MLRASPRSKGEVMQELPPHSFAVYVPGYGFESVASFSGAMEIILMKLAMFRTVDQWPGDIMRLGVYTADAISPGEAFSDADIKARAEAGSVGGYKPLWLVSEVPGSRIERWPCRHCDAGGSDHCDHCSGVGYIDADGEPWPFGDTEFRVQLEFNPPAHLIDSGAEGEEGDGLGFFHGCMNALAIIIVVGGFLGLLWWGLIETGSLDGDSLR